MSAPILILGVDPGLQRCGWGLVACEGVRLSHIAHGVVAPPRDAALAQRLAALLQGLSEVIAAHRPDQAAVEETFVNANARAALALGQARGVALAACAQAGLPVGEYAPAVIKKAVVGAGHAQKEQVAFMVRRLLPAAGAVSADAADALAAALCHAAYGAFRRKAGA
ncbi:MAG: crossover junction endodeoxyribonuclease RuvC [Hyphomonadaceae bacterium]